MLHVFRKIILSFTIIFSLHKFRQYLLYYITKFDKLLSKLLFLILAFVMSRILSIMKVPSRAKPRESAADHLSCILCHNKWEPAQCWHIYNNAQNVFVLISIFIFLHWLNWRWLICGISKFFFISSSTNLYLWFYLWLDKKC